MNSFDFTGPLSKMYFDPLERGWLYLIASPLILFFFHDGMAYYAHRLHHIPLIYKHIHKHHHRLVITTLWIQQIPLWTVKFETSGKIEFIGRFVHQINSFCKQKARSKHTELLYSHACNLCKVNCSFFRYHTPTAFSATAMHPAEFLVFNTIVVIPIFFLPVYSGTQTIVVVCFKCYLIK